MTDEERELVQMFRDAAGPIRPNKHLVAADLIERLSNEVERLRAGGCARDQRTTQYCAEAVRLQADIERLRKERDEARLAYCCEVLVLYGDADEQYRLGPAEVARRKGWLNLLEILTGSPNRSPNRSEVAE